jgi:oligosaccharide reducing-end xylanase
MFIKKISRPSFLLGLSALAVLGSASVDQSYEVGTWGDFAKGAVSFTFDDNTENQLTVAQPMFDKFNFHMTMFVVVDWLGDKLANYSGPFKAGHEIASHSISHSNPMKVNELGPSQAAIKKSVPGEMAVTIAYPNCPSPGDNEVKKNYIAGRICNGSPNGKTPSNFMQISSTIVGSSGVNTTQGLVDIAKQATSQEGWNVYLLHGMSPVNQGESNYSQTSPQALQGCLEYLDKNRDKVWVETFGNVARYIKERNAAIVKEKSSSEEKIIVTVTDNLPDTIFNFPLSIRRPMPDKWETAFATQSGKEIEDSIVTVDGKKYLVFKPVPDGGEIILSEKLATPVKMQNGKLNVSNISPVRFRNNTLVINRNHFNNAALQISLFNINGTLLTSYNIASHSGEMVLPVDIVSASSFIASVKSGEKTWCGMLISR